MRRLNTSGAVLMGLVVGCSSPTAPTHSLAGTWHVAVGMLNSGTISPASFDVKVRQAGGGYLVTMPKLAWSGGLIFDSGPAMAVFTDSTKSGFIEFTRAPHALLCEWVSIYGTRNAGVDTLLGASIVIENNDTITGGCPLTTLGGPAAVNK